jgi:hypothetical protein
MVMVRGAALRVTAAATVRRSEIRVRMRSRDERGFDRSGEVRSVESRVGG